MDEDETVGWSNPSALAIEAHEDSIRQTLAAQAAELAAMREALQIIANPDWTWATPEEMRKIASDRLAALGERRT